MPFSFGWKAFLCPRRTVPPYFSRSRWGVPPYFPVRTGACPLVFPSTTGRGSQRQLAYKNSCLFQKLRNSRSVICVSDPISPTKASCGARKQELKRGLTRYRPTVPGSFVKGEFHGSRHPCQRGVPRLPAALFKGKFLKKKKTFTGKSEKR